MSIAMFAQVLACVAAVVAAAAPAAPQTLYGLMIDAGSEGSRLFIYTWNSSAPDAAQQRLPTPIAVGNFSANPGIGSFALTPERAGSSLEPLLAYAQKELAEHRKIWGRIPIWLRATAGMRLLHADEREVLLDHVRTYLSRSPFYFRKDNAIVITGEEEGVFGWLAVNYRLGYLDHSGPLTANNTIGSLDLGGASSQIVFIPQKSIMSGIFPLFLGARGVRLYSWSFLHFGQQEAELRTADVIISQGLNEVQSVSELDHPCFAQHFLYRPSFSYGDKRSFPMEVEMKGSSDFLKCRDLVTQIFMKDAPCLVNSCSISGVYQPHIYDSRFVAFAHFADVAESLALPENAQLRDLKIAAEYVCSLSLEQLNVIFARVSEKDRTHLCFHSTYILALLTHGYGFSYDSSQITFKGKFDTGEGIDYVTGAMIYELNRDPTLTQPLGEEVSQASSNSERPHVQQLIFG